MGPPLTNPIWVYGSDDDTLFRPLGSDELQKQGYSRKGRGRPDAGNGKRREIR